MFSMAVGLRVDTTGTFHRFIYNELDELEGFVSECGRGCFVLLEYFDINNRTYRVYGYRDGVNFNAFDIELINATGDLIFVCSDGEPDEVEIRNYYLGEYIYDVSTSEELDDYDYDTDWIVDDREFEEVDYISYIDYP